MPGGRASTRSRRAWAGLMSITGAPGGGPMRVGIPIADLSAGLFCALGILTALLERETSGEGQWVSTSLLQAQIFMLDFQAARWLSRGRSGRAGRQQSSDLDPHRRVQDQGRYINIAITGTVMWERFCDAVGHPEWITSPEYVNGKLRSQNRNALNADIDKATATKSSAEWVEILNEVGVPCGPIY